MSALTMRDTPLPGSIFLNQVRSLIMNHKWELLFMGLIIFLYQLSAVIAATHELFLTDIGLFHDGALSYPAQFVFVLFGAFWAFRIWEDLRAGDRSSFLSYPASRVTHQVLRIAAGAVVFVALIISFWLLGAVFCEIIAPPGFSWISASEYNGDGWVVTLIGLLNAYLYANILALFFRRPEIWFLVWIPVSVTVIAFIFGRSGADLLTDFWSRLFTWPAGALAGFGFQYVTYDATPRNLEWLLPSLFVMVLWTVIYTGVIYLVARSYRES